MSTFSWVKVDASWLTWQASNGIVPLWLRVALASWGAMDHKGIATFGALGLDGATAANWSAGDGPLQVDAGTGELVEPAKLTRALRTAELRGYVSIGATVERVAIPPTVASVGRIARAPWRKVHRAFVEQCVTDASVPGWVRVSLAGSSRVNRNGVACFRPDGLANVAKVSNVRREIATAVAAGWLAPGSTATRVEPFAWVGAPLAAA